MAKSKIMEKIEEKHIFSVEGFLNVDDLQEGSIICEVEEEGEIDLIGYLKKFNSELIKLSIVKKEDKMEE